MSGSGKHPGREEKKERELATRFAKGGVANIYGKLRLF